MYCGSLVAYGCVEYAAAASLILLGGSETYRRQMTMYLTGLHIIHSSFPVSRIRVKRQAKSSLPSIHAAFSLYVQSYALRLAVSTFILAVFRGNLSCGS